MVLQSAEIPAVTQARASDDYHPGQTGFWPNAKDPSGRTGCGFPYCVYYVGTTSLMHWALDLKPSKDNYWSTPKQGQGGPYGNTTREPYNEMQGMISAYTTGPVAPSDRVGSSNASLIRMACTSGGRLLQPSRPATAIDACFAGPAFGNGPAAAVRNVYPVFSSHTEVPSSSEGAALKFAHVYTIGLAAPFRLRPSMLPADLDSAHPHGLTVWTGYGAGNATVLGHFGELLLPSCGYADFGLYHVAPALPCGLVLLGETDKWVPVSAFRFAALDASADGATLSLRGEPREQVHISFAIAAKVYTAHCAIGASGTASLVAKMASGAAPTFHC